MGGAELAREMWDAGERVALIARAVGTTHAAIVGFAHRNGWPPHPKQPTGGLRRVTRAGLEGAPQPVPKPRRPPKPAPEPKLRREACRPEPLAVPTARFRGCQWPEGSPKERGFHFCGAALVVAGTPYCAAHAKVAYYSRPSSRDAEEAAA
jgi:GcrA cell cycle regulator